MWHKRCKKWIFCLPGSFSDGFKTKVFPQVTATGNIWKYYENKSQSIGISIIIRIQIKKEQQRECSGKSQQTSKYPICPNIVSAWKVGDQEITIPPNMQMQTEKKKAKKGRKINLKYCIHTHKGIMAGKLKGHIPAHTPSGSLILYVSMPFATLATYSPIWRLPIPHACSTTSTNWNTKLPKFVCKRSSSEVQKTFLGTLLQ